MNRANLRNLADVVRVSRAVGRPVTAGDLSVALGVSRDAARDRLRKLADLDLVERVGVTGSGYAWQVRA